MEVIPSINYSDEKQVWEITPKLEVLRGRGVTEVHLDISDGKFTPVATGLQPEVFESILGEKFRFGLHLLVRDVMSYLSAWEFAKNIKSVVLHQESDFDFDEVIDFCLGKNIELIFSLRIGGNLKDFLSVIEIANAKTAELLAVPIGSSGEPLDESALEQAKLIKSVHPSLRVFIDGGVNEKTAQRIKESGADGVICGSFLWKSQDVGLTYDFLKNV